MALTVECINGRITPVYTHPTLHRTSQAHLFTVCTLPVVGFIPGFGGEIRSVITGFVAASGIGVVSGVCVSARILLILVVRLLFRLDRGGAGKHYARQKQK